MDREKTDGGKRNRLLGVTVGAGVLAISLLVILIAADYLTEYGSQRTFLVVSVGVAGVVGAILCFLLVSSFCRTRKCSVVALLFLLLVTAGPLLSMKWPGTVTYARFGLTVYGIIPVPILDVTVNSNGVLWFRDKSHELSVGEVRALLTPEVEVVVIGNGWNSAVRVDPAIEALDGVDVRIVPTPEAFELFNRCRSEKKTAVLIAHSTC